MVNEESISNSVCDPSDNNQRMRINSIMELVRNTFLWTTRTNMCNGYWICYFNKHCSIPTNMEF